MNNTQAVLSFADKFYKYTFLQLIDKQESFNLIKKKLISFHNDWREETGATHGGITANHREMVWALLKILPMSMEHFRANNPRRFRNLLRDGRYLLKTTRESIAKVMADEAITVSVRTVSNLISRLMKAGIIIYKKPIREVGIELELNPELIALWATSEELDMMDQAEELAAKVSDLSEEESKALVIAQLGEEEDMSTDGELAPIDGEIQALVSAQNDDAEGITPPNNSFLQPYTNQNTETIEKKEKEGNAVLAIANDKIMMSKQKMRNGDSANQVTVEMLLVAQLLAAVFNDRELSDSDHRAACDLIGTHLESARGMVRDWRGICIRRVKSSKAYENAQNKEKFLLNFQKKLPDVDRRAFELISMAINIQSDYLKRVDYKLYMNTCKYLANNFYKALSYAKDLMMKQFEHPINNTVFHAHVLVRSELLRAVSNVSMIYQKEGGNRAVEVYGREFDKLVQLMNSDECRDLTAEHHETYLNRLKNQLQHLFHV